MIVRGEGTLSKEAQENETLLFHMHVRATFAARHVLERYHLNREALEWVLGEIEAKFNQAVAHPGKICGTLTAQSIGEPATQMTLNTFHYAGVSSKNITLSVPCLKEIINIATNIKTPSLSVYLKSEIAKDSMHVKNVQQELAFTSLRTVTAAVEIWYVPDPSSTIIEDDEDFVHAFFAIPDQVEQKLHLMSLWLLRLELNRAKMIDRKLTMTYVANRVAQSFKTDLLVIWRTSPRSWSSTVVYWVVRIRTRRTSGRSGRISSCANSRTRCSTRSSVVSPVSSVLPCSSTTRSPSRH